MSSPEDPKAGPVIRDRRRIDPDTGQVRQPGQPGDTGRRGAQDGPAERGRHAVGRAGQPAPPAETGDPQTAADTDARNDMAVTQAQLAERTADVQRIQAEYANYRKRVERDRIAVREQALPNVLAELLPILDDIGRAREHGELSGGFKSVADSLESTVAKLGLVSYGEKGEPFDPMIHEALMHSYSDQVSEPICVQILQPGYKVGDRTLRPARVAVAEPGGDSGPEDDAAAAGAAGQFPDDDAARGGTKPRGSVTDDGD